MSAWIVPRGQDVLTFRSFIYRITLPDGRYYVGRKNVYRCSVGKIVAESDWRDYWSSSKEVKALATGAGYGACRREILQLLESTGKAGLAETRWLIVNNAMLDPQCLNDNMRASISARSRRFGATMRGAPDI